MRSCISSSQNYSCNTSFTIVSSHPCSSHDVWIRHIWEVFVFEECMVHRQSAYNGVRAWKICASGVIFDFSYTFVYLLGFLEFTFIYMKPAIVCQWIILDALWRVLLIKRKHNKKNLPNYWAFPGWNQEIGETNEETVMREVKEEVWLDFVITRLFIEWEGISGYYAYRYIGTYSGVVTVQEEECDGYAWFSFHETEHLLIPPLVSDILQKLHDQNILL